MPGERGGSALGVAAVAQRGRQVWAQHRSNVCQSFGRCRRPLIYACHMFLIIAPALVRVRRACGIACARARTCALVSARRGQSVSAGGPRSPPGLCCLSIGLGLRRLLKCPCRDGGGERERDQDGQQKLSPRATAPRLASPLTYLKTSIFLIHAPAGTAAPAASPKNPPRKRPWSQTPSVFRQHRPQAG